MPPRPVPDGMPGGHPRPPDDRHDARVRTPQGGSGIGPHVGACRPRGTGRSGAGRIGSGHTHRSSDEKKSRGSGEDPRLLNFPAPHAHRARQDPAHDVLIAVST